MMLLTVLPEDNFVKNLYRQFADDNVYMDLYKIRNSANFRYKITRKYLRIY